MKRLSALTAALVVANISACSPYVYKQEITTFSSGVGSAISSYQVGQQAIAGLILVDQETDYEKALSGLKLTNGCVNADALPPSLSECSVVSTDGEASFAARTRSEIAIEKKLAEAGPTLNALQAYANALNAVVNATDDATLKTASQALLTSAGTFSTAVSKLALDGTPPPTAIATPAIELLTVGATAYLDRQRYAALRATVPSMQDFVSTAGTTMRDALLLIRRLQLRRLIRAMMDEQLALEPGAVGKLSPSDYKTQLVVLESNVATFNQARMSDPSAVVSGLIETHKKLAEALTKNEGQNAAIYAEALDFANSAGQLKTAVAAGASDVAASAPSAAP